MDKLTLLRRYPTQTIYQIIDKATDVVDLHGWYRHPTVKAGSSERLHMILPTEDGEPSPGFADLQFRVRIKGSSSAVGFVRAEWNPAKAGVHGNAHVLAELLQMLPDSRDAFLDQAYVSRIDLAVDVPGISCSEIAAVRSSRHKKARVYLDASGKVESLSVGDRGTSSKSAACLRVYGRDLPQHDGQPGLRAEIQLGSVGRLAAFAAMKNPFPSFALYQFGSAAEAGLNAAFVALVRERGDVRAVKAMKNEPSMAEALQTLLDTSRATWWQPDDLWDQARQRVAGLFAGKGSPTPSLAA